MRNGESVHAVLGAKPSHSPPAANFSSAPVFACTATQPGSLTTLSLDGRNLCTMLHLAQTLDLMRPVA